MRRSAFLVPALVPTLILLVFAASCGTGFKLPIETRALLAPGNGTYERIDTWSGLPRIADLLLTRNANPANEQLYLLFKTVNSDSGSVVAYPLATQEPFSFRFRGGLMNPVALCGNATRLFVLDEGDSCLARRNPATGRCDTTGNSLLPRDLKWTNRVAYLEYNWRVREYFLDGDTASTFTDTTMAWVQGIAVDDHERVYVSGLWFEVVQTASFEYSRKLVWRIHRYVRGGGDSNMPGGPWHRDPAYAVSQGSGISTVSDPRGIDWGPDGGGALYIADSGNNRGLRRSESPSLATDYSMIASEQGDIGLPSDISVDLAGYVYVVDTEHSQVVRYRAGGQGFGEFVQRVDIEPNKTTGIPIAQPVAVAADNDLVYVADGQRGELAIFRRRR